MVLVAAAGPAMNIALAVIAALTFHIVGYLPGSSAQWLADNLKNALPLDGGRILVGILPKFAAAAIARLEPYGMLILISLFIFLPMLGAQLGVDLTFVARVLAVATRAVVGTILFVTGNT